MIELPEGVELVRTQHSGDETILEYEDNLPELVFLFELFSGITFLNLVCPINNSP